MTRDTQGLLQMTEITGMTKELLKMIEITGMTRDDWYD